MAVSCIFCPVDAAHANTCRLLWQALKSVLKQQTDHLHRRLTTGPAISRSATLPGCFCTCALLLNNLRATDLQTPTHPVRLGPTRPCESGSDPGVGRVEQSECWNDETRAELAKASSSPEPPEAPERYDTRYDTVKPVVTGRVLDGPIGWKLSTCLYYLVLTLKS